MSLIQCHKIVTPISQLHIYKGRPEHKWERMTINIHTPKISLYNLFGDANAPEAYESLLSRCQIVTHVSRNNATGHSKDADLAHIHMLYGEKVASLCESHHTYHAAGYTFATMPYTDAQAIPDKLAYTPHSFEPSVLNETIEKIRSEHYRVLIDTEAPELFRPVIDCINKHYIKGPERLVMAHMIGKHFIAIPKQHFDKLVNIWQHDRISPAHHDLVTRLKDFNSGESLMDSQLRDHLNMLLGTPGNMTREQLDAKAYICTQSYRNQSLSVDRQYMEKKYGKEFADAVNGKYQHSYTRNQHNHFFPLPLVKMIEKYIETHPTAGENEANGLLQLLFQTAKDNSYHIFLPVQKTERTEKALGSINRSYEFSQPVQWNNSMNDPHYTPKWSLSMRLGQYETLANAWLGQGTATSLPQHMKATDTNRMPYDNLGKFKPRERVTGTRPDPNRVDNVVTFDFKKKERVR